MHAPQVAVPFVLSYRFGSRRRPSLSQFGVLDLETGECFWNVDVTHALHCRVQLFRDANDTCAQDLNPEAR